MNEHVRVVVIGGGNMGAGGMTHHKQIVRVSTMFVNVCSNPCQGFTGIVEEVGKAGFRVEPIVGQNTQNAFDAV